MSGGNGRWSLAGIPPAVGAISLLSLLAVVWGDRFLPMQDYPQHLFMATVAGTWDDPALNWAENFELRGAFGPYRGAFLVQRALGSVFGMEAAGKVLVSIYLLLMAVVAWRLYRNNADTGAGWAALLVIPLALHPMYYYGFVNFILALPVLMLLLLDLPGLFRERLHWPELTRFLLLVLCLFLLHPYVLLVATVLAAASLPLLVRDRGQWLRGATALLVCALPLLAWALGDSSGLDSGGGFSIEGLNMKWWQWDWSLKFLGLTFTGMRITEDPDWYVAAAWGGALAVVLAGLIGNRARFRFRPRFLLLALLALAGVFVLPFSIEVDARYTFFNVRLVPVASLLLVAFLATIPLGRPGGIALATLSLALTLSAASLHHRLAREVESYMPLFADMEEGATVLPLVRVSPSLWLDGFFYVNFYYHFPFYYHLYHGGNTPDMFNTRMMPVGYREGRRPPRPRQNQPEKWTAYREHYDYVITRRVSIDVHRELARQSSETVEQGPWRRYRLR